MICILSSSPLQRAHERHGSRGSTCLTLVLQPSSNLIRTPAIGEVDILFKNIHTQWEEQERGRDTS